MAVAVTGFASVVIATGQLLEQGLGLEFAAAPSSHGIYEAPGQLISLEPWEMAQGRQDAAPAAVARPVFVQTVSTASDTGKSFHTGGDDTYRTVCVRLCDGYYWTVSFSTTEENFARDQGRCEASCGVPARLYKYKNPGGRPEEMEDLDGQPYGKLKTAFVFRTRFDAACRCQANPWEREARARHRLYELASAPAAKLSASHKAEAEQLRQVVESGAAERKVKGAEVVVALKIAPAGKGVRTAKSAGSSRARRRARDADASGAAAQGNGESEDAAMSGPAGQGEGDGRPVIAAAAKNTGRGGVMRLGGPAPRPAAAGSGSSRPSARVADWRQRVFSSATGN